MIVDGIQAWLRAGGAVDVLDSPAETTDQVVVVVADAPLVQGWAAVGLDPADDAGIGTGTQHVAPLSEHRQRCHTGCCDTKPVPPYETDRSLACLVDHGVTQPHLPGRSQDLDLLHVDFV